MSILRCVLCPAAAGDSLAAGWTTRTLDGPVAYRSRLGGPLPPTPAGTHHLCPTCTTWLAGHRDRALPPAVVDGITATVAAAGLHPATARVLRRELVGIVRHLAEAFTHTRGPGE
ncbi:hypothetical protein ACN267_32255 [Micromonospora sp. WMMD734]|uniref:hypothetical protein n=1 Tax=Micromonospora sp. WMMD734 TaxID=3404129 RepID=UPI003B92F3E6